MSSTVGHLCTLTAVRTWALSWHFGPCLDSPWYKALNSRHVKQAAINESNKKDREKQRVRLGCNGRHQRSIREDDSAALRSCCFLASKQQLLLGTHGGEVRIYEAGSGTMLDEVALHSQPINSLKVALF